MQMTILKNLQKVNLKKTNKINLIIELTEKPNKNDFFFEFYIYLIEFKLILNQQHNKFKLYLLILYRYKKFWGWLKSYLLFLLATPLL